MWQGPCPGTGNDTGTAQQGSQAPPGSVRPGSYSLRVPLCSPVLLSLPPAPRTRAGVFWNADTDPCQSQLGEINMPGLKGPGAAGGSRAVTHGLPARHSRPCLGHPVPGQPMALPSLALHPPRQSRALCPPCRAPRAELWHPGDSRGCGTAVTLPAWCQVWLEPRGPHPARVCV